LKTLIDNVQKFALEWWKKKPWKQNYARSVIWSFIDKGFKFLAELLIGFYLATALGVARFGMLNYAISFIVLFQGISTLGLSDLLTRELINFKDQRGKILGTAVSMRLGASLLFTVVINVVAFHEDHLVRQLIFAISMSLIFRSFEVLVYFYQSIVKSEWVAKIQILSTILISISKILLIVQQAELQAYAWVYTFEWVLIALGLLLVFTKTRIYEVWKIDRSFARRLLIESWPLMVSSVAINLYMRMDQVMLREMHGDVENGYYAAALRLTEIWYVIPTVIGSILFPAVLNAKSTDQVKYRDRILQLNAFMFWVSFMLAIVISPMAEFLIVTLYNDDFRHAGIILSIQIWSGIFTFMGVSGTFWLMAENLQYVSLIRTLLGLSVNVVLNFMLIPRFGAIGAAVSMLITQAFATTISLLLLKKTRIFIKIQMQSVIYPFHFLKNRRR
jgi:O-antigen/teichoic acid export membrane protein